MSRVELILILVASGELAACFTGPHVEPPRDGGRIAAYNVARSDALQGQAGFGAGGAGRGGVLPTPGPGAGSGGMGTAEVAAR